MSIKHVWTVICAKALTDQESRNVSLVDVIEQLNFVIPTPSRGEGGPASAGKGVTVPIEYSVVSLWARDVVGQDAIGAVRILLVDPSGTEVMKIEQGVTIPKDKYRMRVNNRVSGFMVTAAGLYKLVVMLKDSGAGEFAVVGEVPLDVNVHGADGSVKVGVV